MHRVVELETYRLTALLGLASVKEFLGRLGLIEDVVRTLTNDLAEQTKRPFGQVEASFSTLWAKPSQIIDINAESPYRLAATKANPNILTSRLKRMPMKRLSKF